ncbi:MAG: Gfo/Idh/MocA family oxidoreductase [Victivallales bacterium]|nr:Gfo/Idh/MocA family oxidoreductase [Victivallales bacterium]
MKLCVIGNRGHIGYVFQSIHEVPNLELPALSTGSDDAPDRLLQLSHNAHFQPVVFPDWQEMLRQIQPDIVAIDGPWHLHATMAAFALRLGIHVFCEKPIALTLEDLEAVRQAQASTGAHILSMVGLRYQADFQHALSLVRGGAVGKVKMIRAQKSYKLGKRPDFCRERNTYGGTIPWVGSHALDWILAFSGSPFQTIFATHTAEDNHGYGSLEIACQVLATMQNGVQALASIDYLRPDAASSHGDDRIRVAGTTGILEVVGGKVTLLDNQGLRELPVPPAPRHLFSDFARSIASNSPLWVPETETFELTRACLLARDSADSGKVLVVSG